MKRIIIVAAAVLAFAATAESARRGPFGLGIIVGEPTGLNGKLFINGSNAIEAAVAWSLRGDNDLHVQVDYLYHRYRALRVESGRLPLFFGLGGRVALRENRDDLVGIRIPVGLAYEFEDAPFDVFVQIVPLLELIPDTEFELEGALGARFWF